MLEENIFLSHDECIERTYWVKHNSTISCIHSYVLGSISRSLNPHKTHYPEVGEEECNDMYTLHADRIICIYLGKHDMDRRDK